MKALWMRRAVPRALSRQASGLVLEASSRPIFEPLATPVAHRHAQRASSGGDLRRTPTLALPRSRWRLVTARGRSEWGSLSMRRTRLKVPGASWAWSRALFGRATRSKGHCRRAVGPRLALASSMRCAIAGSTLATRCDAPRRRRLVLRTLLRPGTRAGAGLRHLRRRSARVQPSSWPGRGRPLSRS
jgi:hypothetical protein